MSVDRQRVRACIHPETYKYFLPLQRVRDVWHALQARYGSVEHQGGFGVMQIATERMVLRSTAAANPITVIRKRRCTPKDIDEVHALLGYEEHRGR